jgi:hypothetical protein
MLESLNIAAVGLSLAAATSAVFRALMSGDGAKIVFVTGLPTLLVGMLWAKVLRSKKTVGATTMRVGWLLSLPLAIANSSLAGGLLMAFDSHPNGLIERFFLGAALGATFGVVFWLPGLLLTLACFGLPIASAQSLARKGLAGEERGERIVGVASAVIAALAFMGSFVDANVWHHGMDALGVWSVRGLSILGGLTGLVTAYLAWRREGQRRAFVSEVEAGNVPQFRVDASSEGKVLVRVVAQGQGYRVADYVEEVAALDREGAVTRAVRDD